MKFGTYYAYWEQEWEADYIKYCHKVAELGFDVLEIAATGLLKMTEEQQEELVRTANELGIEISTCIGLPAEYNVASLDEAVRKRGIEHLKSIIMTMKKINSKKLGGVIYAYWPADYTKPVNKELEKEASAKSIREVADFAKDYDVTLMIEVLNRFEQYLINDAKEAVEYIKMVGKDNVKVMLDCFHMNIEEDDIATSIRNTGKYLGHFHVGECNRKVPGKGHMPWKEMGEALNDIGYEGYVVMEPFVKMGGQVGSDIKVYRDLSDDADDAKMDKDIEESLVFLREAFAKK